MNDDMMPKKKKPMMDQKEESAAVSDEDLGKTTLSIAQYPDLSGVEAGAEVHGSFTGKVESNDGKVAVITYETVDLNTENKADLALAKLTGKPTRPAPEKPKDEEGDY